MTRLLDTSSVTVGAFTCPPHDVAWRTTNYIGDRLHVVFPHTPVVIRQHGKEAVLTTPNHTVFYEPDQLYERELRSTRGDQCVFVSVSQAALGRLDPPGSTAVLRPMDRKAYLAQHLLVRRLKARQVTKREAENAALELVRVALSRRVPRPVAARPTTAAAHHALAEAAKAELTSGLDRPQSLADLARSLHTSPFHLARVFRAQTGFSINDYTRALRLKVGLELLPETTSGLTTLALELGFATHSQFTEAFRREFGLVPSLLRGEALPAD